MQSQDEASIQDGEEEVYQDQPPVQEEVDHETFLANRRKEEEDLKRKIREIALKHPEMPINKEDFLKGQLDDLDLDELKNVLENLQLNVNRVMAWTPVEKASIHALCNGIQSVTGADIEADLIADVEAKVEFREMCQSLPLVNSPTARFLFRVGAMVSSKFVDAAHTFFSSVRQHEQAAAAATEGTAVQAPPTTGAAVLG